MSAPPAPVSMHVPSIESADDGELVPMPTFPLAKTVSKVEVAVPAVVEAMVNSGVLAVVPTEFEIDKREYGEVVPIPKKPDAVIRNFSESDWSVVPLAPASEVLKTILPPAAFPVAFPPAIVVLAP